MRFYQDSIPQPTLCEHRLTRSLTNSATAPTYDLMITNGDMCCNNSKIKCVCVYMFPWKSIGFRCNSQWQLIDEILFFALWKMEAKRPKNRTLGRSKEENWIHWCYAFRRTIASYFFTLYFFTYFRRNISATISNGTRLICRYLDS